MRIVFEDVRARVAAHEELIGQGTGNYQSVAPGNVIVEAGRGVVFALPFPVFQALAPDAVYDPDTRQFTERDEVLDPWTPEV
jgi:azurin